MDLLALYALTFTISFMTYIWYGRQFHDLALSDLVGMFVLSLIPAINVIFVILVVQDWLSELDFNFKDPVIIKKRK